MDANQLFFWMRGFFEQVTEPSPAQITALRNEVLRAKPVENQIIPVTVQNPISGTGDCGCKKKIP